MKGAIELRVDELKKVLDPVLVTKKALPVFIANTPIRTGNARRNTDIGQNQTTIEANYAYAQRLDNGYSRQRPNGMIKPTVEFIRKYLKNNIGK